MMFTAWLLTPQESFAPPDKSATSLQSVFGTTRPWNVSLAFLALYAKVLRTSPFLLMAVTSQPQPLTMSTASLFIVGVLS